MKLLEITYCYIDKGQYLSEIEPFKSIGIPTNTVVDKTLPGLGATQREITFEKRNSIVAVANTPPIEGKQIKHPNILGVYKGVEKPDIKEYLENDIYPKKIVCTPEAYIDKVKPVILESKFNLYEDFFMLLDECERLITDVDYRAKIIAPIADFFLFRNKAMISATVLHFSYSKFSNHGFKILKVIPRFDFKKPINLINTNNLVASLRRSLEIEREHPLFLFLNSTLTIYSIVKMLSIESSTKVFCSKDSVRTLFDLGFKNANSTLGGFEKQNILTSRFFSAVDIDLDYSPDVIMITDVFTARHSILDPLTESIQICGRFRNGIGKISHITNFNTAINSKSELAAREFINGGYGAYRDMLGGYNEAKSEGEKLAYKEALQNIGVAKYVDDEHQLDDFMVDNFVHEERVKGYYINSTDLIKAYENTEHFEVYPEKHLLPVSDEDNMKMAKARTQNEICKAVAKALRKYNEPYAPGTFRFFDAKTEINRLESLYPEVCNLYKEIGFEGFERAEFNKTAIRKAVRGKNKIDMKYNPLLLKVIYKEFVAPNIYTEVEILDKLTIIYAKLDITEEPAAAHIMRYFDGNRTTKNRLKYYSISKKIDIENRKKSLKK
jgi:hypothetical protein